MSDINLSYFFLPDYRTGDSRSSDSGSSSDESSEDEEIVHPSNNLPLLFLGREIVRQRDDRDDGDNGIYTHGHPHTAPPNNESYSDENSSDGAATDDECTPPTGPPSPWRNSTAKAIIIKALKDKASDIHLFIGAFGPKHWKQQSFRKRC